MRSPTSNATEHHGKATRFFWLILTGATFVSLAGNIAHAVLPYIPASVIKIGAAAIPPIVLLAAVHGIAVAVRAGASGRVYTCAVAAVAAIGLGAFAVSFLALRDLMLEIGYGTATAWVFPAIIDTAVAVSTLMLVALGDKPSRGTRTVKPACNANHGAADPNGRQRATDAKGQSNAATQIPKPRLSRDAQSQSDANLAAKLIASGATTQSTETVVAVLDSHRRGGSINAAAKGAGINFRTAQRILEAAGAWTEDLRPAG